MSNWKEKRKQAKIAAVLAEEQVHQARLDQLIKVLVRIRALSTDIEEAHICRRARELDGEDVLTEIAEINYKIMEACDETIPANYEINQVSDSVPV